MSQKIEVTENKACPSKNAHMEWTEPFNSFNSWKGLMYREQYEAILQERLLPPVEASIDPSYICNVDCVWCNSRRILRSEKLQGHQIETSHLMNLVRFLIGWGVKAFCYAGGGESTLHPHLWDAMELAYENGRQNAVITNGIEIDTPEKQETAVRTCRWVGVSLDAATSERFGQVKNTDPRNFQKVLDNIRNMVKIKKDKNYQCDVAVKYLIHPSNADQIYDACLLAKELGAAHFHARPAASENIEGLNTTLKFPMDIINDQLERCISLQTDDFKAFGVRHKFTESFNLDHGFSRCLSSPLMLQCGADGNVYLCSDWRGSPKHIIGAHWPNPEQILEFWGSKKHIELINSIDVQKCPRCTYGIYARQIERAVEQDGMCVNFP